MEQTIAFVLGVFTVLAIASVISMFRTRGQVNDLHEEIEYLQNTINELEREIHRDTDLLDRRIDGEIDRTDKMYETLYKYIDSRTDKMESRLEDVIAKLIADTYSVMDARFNDNTAFVDKLYHQIEELNQNKKNK